LRTKQAIWSNPLSTVYWKKFQSVSWTFCQLADTWLVHNHLA
jgi:hypothetical protein